MPYIEKSTRPAMDEAIMAIKNLIIELEMPIGEGLFSDLLFDFYTYYSVSRNYKDGHPLTKIFKKAKVKVDGDLSYILFKFCKYYIRRDYNSYKLYIAEIERCANKVLNKNYRGASVKKQINFYAELNEAVAEIRKQLLWPHEKERKIMNGDI